MEHQIMSHAAISLADHFFGMKATPSEIIEIWLSHQPWWLKVDYWWINTGPAVMTDEWQLVLTAACATKDETMAPLIKIHWPSEKRWESWSACSPGVTPKWRDLAASRAIINRRHEIQYEKMMSSNLKITNWKSWIKNVIESKKIFWN